MKCLRCQEPNPPQARFCSDCGARLVAACPGCGVDLPDGSRFCFACGQRVIPPSDDTSRARPPAAYTPKHLVERILTSRAALEGERKQVTVLFADLKGSMELLADRDPEEARKLLDPVLEHMMEAVHRYEGTVNQVMGDGIMALFGAPLAHEDHAVRACYAALHMQESVRRYAEEVFRSYGVPVQIRVGLNSGEVVVRTIGNDLHMDYSAVGHTTHLGGRMEQLALPGTILVAPDTARLAEGRVTLRSLGPIAVRGLPTPLEVYELTGKTPGRSRLHAAAARGLSRFVGRDPEIEELARALDLAAASRGQVVALVGEPGVGKSRLSYEFAHSDRARDWRLLEASSVSYGKATSYLPLVDLLRRYFDVADRDQPAEIRDKVTQRIRKLDPALEPLLPALLALLDVPDPHWERLDPAERRQRTHEALKVLIVRESHVRPLILILEDLHWIDGETQAFLDGLVERMPTARLLLLVTYRPEYRHSWSSKSYYRQLNLDLLASESANALLLELLGDDPSLGQVKAILTERAEANPLFLEESVRTLVETGALSGARGAYRLVRSLSSIQVPLTVQAILASRIDRLAPEDKEVLQAASVIGKDVPLELLAAIAGGGAEPLRDTLGRLQTAEFLYEVGALPDQQYAFRHPLMHEVAYAGLLHERRRVLHARVMEAIERLDTSRAAAQLDRLAHHAFQGEIWDKALAYCRAAAARDFARSANAEALNRVDQALHALGRLEEPPRDTLSELLLVAQRAAALRALRGYASAEVEAVYWQARALCQAVGDTPERFGVEWQQMQFFLVRGELDTAAELSTRLLDQAEGRQDRSQLMDAHLATGMTLFHQGRFAEARDHLEQGVALYRPEEDQPHLVTHGQDPGVFCLSYLAYTLWFLGYPDQASARAESALKVARRSAHAFSSVSALTFVARVSQCRRDLARTMDVAREVIRASREHGFAYYEAQGRIQLGWALAMAEGDESGCSEILEGYAALEKTGTVLGLRGALVQLAEAYVSVGRGKEALAALDAPHDPTRGRETLCWDAEFARIRGELAAPESGASAIDWYEEALRIARAQGARSLELRAALSYAKLLCAMDRREDAQRVLGGVVERFTEGHATVEQRESLALLAGGTT
jgi:class 3 adenylate cyclase/tetratricopeptide (TPR) repeat protein